MIMVYGFIGYLNHVHLPMPHIHVLKKQPYCLMCTKLSCNFILCPTDKYMFKVNKRVFGNCESSIYCQNNYFRKSCLLFDTCVLTNKVFMLFTCKNFMFSNFTGKKYFCSTKWCGRRWWGRLTRLWLRLKYLQIIMRQCTAKPVWIGHV